MMTVCGRYPEVVEEWFVVMLGNDRERWGTLEMLPMWKCCRNRPLRGFATHRDANTPSEASAECQYQLPMRFSRKERKGRKERSDECQ